MVAAASSKLVMLDWKEHSDVPYKVVKFQSSHLSFQQDISVVTWMTWKYHNVVEALLDNRI